MKLKKYIPLIFLFLLVLLCFAACGAKQNGMTYKIKDNTAVIVGYTDKTTITEIAVPDEINGLPVTEIADFGLCNAESLKKITIGKNIEKIGTWALTNNQHLESYEVNPENKYFKSEDGVLFTKDGKTLVSYPGGKGIEFDIYGRATNAASYIIPDGVEIIGSKAFYKCGHVDIAAFPDSLKRIEEKAFFKCYYYEEFTKDNIVISGLSDFDLPEGIEYIGKDAFAYDELLTNLTIPASIREIGDFAFFNCKKMEKLTILAKEEDILLGNKWQPTSKGKIMDNCEVIFR